MKLILASSSVHRKKILEYLEYPFTVLIPDIDESAIVAKTPHALVAEIALAKAKKALSLLKDSSPTVLISADSLALNSFGEVLGKPKDAEDARRIVGSIIGTTHSLLTGYTIIKTSPYTEISATAETLVTMRTVEPPEFDDYIASNAWQGLAGGYGIQREAKSFVSNIQGCFLNVVGLPLNEIVGHLIALGIPLSMNKAKCNCEDTNTITCCID